MEYPNLKSNWNQIKGRIKQQFTNLTDDDLNYQEGHEEELISRIQKRTGKSRDEVVRYFK